MDKIYASHGIHTLRLDDFSHLSSKLPFLFTASGGVAETACGLLET